MLACGLPLQSWRCVVAALLLLLAAPRSGGVVRATGRRLVGVGAEPSGHAASIAIIAVCCFVGGALAWAAVRYIGVRGRQWTADRLAAKSASELADELPEAQQALDMPDDGGEGDEALPLVRSPQLTASGDAFSLASCTKLATRCAVRAAGSRVRM